MGPVMRGSMPLNQLIESTTRVVEVGAKRSRLPRSLARSGVGQVLEVVFDEPTRAQLEQESPILPDCFVLANSRKAVAKNNAQLLILGPGALRSIASFRAIRHAEWVAWENRITPGTILARLAAHYRRWRGELGSPLQVSTGSSKVPGPSLLVYPVLKPHPPGARRYIPHSLGVEGFFHALTELDARYAVLRWFDDLPHVAPGEDIDLLVDDQHLPQVRELLDSGPGVQPVDLYSTSGLPGADYRSLPYFPPYLATAILDRAVDHRGLCRVPSPLDHFRSMAFHALYHKGFSARIPSRWQRLPQFGRPEHDYPSILHQMAQGLDLDVPMTMEGLDAWLDAEAWRPPHDMLLRLAKKNRWLASQLGDSADGPFDDQIAVFLLRREGLNRGGIDRVVALLLREGFQLLTTYAFAPDQVDSLARTLRGGNWGVGPWPISGGPPVAAIVMFDPAPLKLSRRQRRKHPLVASQRFLCKQRIRDQLNQGYPASEHCNTIHSSDNGREAYDYLRVVMPDRLEEIVAMAAQLREQQRHSPRQAA